MFSIMRVPPERALYPLKMGSGEASADLQSTWYADSGRCPSSSWEGAAIHKEIEQLELILKEDFFWSHPVI